MNDLLLAFYGDDFTGSTDALESLAEAGIAAALFTQPPTADMLLRFPDLQAIGVAGQTRALHPEAMDVHLRPALHRLAELRPRHIHYKICSTFDSSPEQGSIGHVMDLARQCLPGPYLPVVATAPALGRFTAFGHHFATPGIGQWETVYRLDRHPSASGHPATPMGESDLRKHLARQTQMSIGLFDLRNYERSFAQQVAALDQLLADGAEAVIFDGLNERHLQHIGRLIEQSVADRGPLFSVGSSAIETALAGCWVRQGRVRAAALPNAAPAVEQVLAVSGSCSPVTEAQIAWAAGAGFEEVPLPTATFAAAEDPTAWLTQPLQQVTTLLKAGKSVIVHTCRGRDDRRIAETKAAWTGRHGASAKARFAPASLLGGLLGRLLRGVLQRIQVPRLCIAGGDTASFAVAELGVDAFRLASRLTRGAPLCRIAAADRRLDGVEIALKGGQVGRENFFETLRSGGPAS